MSNVASLKKRLTKLWPHLNERSRRMTAANEAIRLGHGGISKVSCACGLSRVTITKAIKELDAPPLATGRMRRQGGGRRSLQDLDPSLSRDLESMVDVTDDLKLP